MTTVPLDDHLPARLVELACRAGEDEARGVRVARGDALVAALRRARDESDRLTLIQAVTGPLDVSPLLTAVAEAAARANASAAGPA